MCRVNFGSPTCNGPRPSECRGENISQISPYMLAFIFQIQVGFGRPRRYSRPRGPRRYPQPNFLCIPYRYRKPERAWLLY